MYRPIIGGAKCIVAPNQNFGGVMAPRGPRGSAFHGLTTSQTMHSKRSRSMDQRQRSQ